MTKRAAYAASADGMSAYKFSSKALRDLAVEMISGIEKSTCAIWTKVERNDSTIHPKRNEWGYRIDTSYNAYDMSISEYWDGEWDEVYERACELGII